MLPTYLINLAKRPDRLKIATNILNQHGISAELCEAIEIDNGADGIRQTMIGLFDHILNNTNHEHVLVLEDDVSFTLPDFWGAVYNSFKELPADYDLLFLGANVYKPLLPHSKHLYKLTGAVANHAMIYPRKTIIELLDLYTNNPKGVTDSLMDTHIVSRGNSYVSNPLIAIQRPDFSNIENRHMDYTRYIQYRYEQAVRKLGSGK